MISLLLFGFGFVAGWLHGQGKLIPWVAGVAGKARGVVLGSRPAPRDQVIPDAKMIAEVSPPPANKPISAGKAVANVLGFFGGLLTWCARNPIVAIGLIVLALWMVMGAPFGFGKSKSELRLEREIAEANARVAEFETSIAELSAQLAENSVNDRRRVDRIVSDANEELDHAVEAVDPSALYDVYRSAYDSVWLDRAPASESNPATREPDTVRGAPSNPA